MRGIIFKPDLTLANLEGRKTRTSRCKGLDKINEHPDKWVVDFVEELNIGDAWFSNTTTMRKIKCPYGVVGSELYGKETYWQYGCWWSIYGKHTFHADWNEPIYYTDTLPKDLKVLKGFDGFGYYKRSAMMMPERASRYHIILTGIGCQRIRSITPEDIEKEGTPANPMELLSYRNDAYQRRLDFAFLLDTINKEKRPWKNNHWVWYLYYTVKKKEASHD